MLNTQYTPVYLHNKKNVLFLGISFDALHHAKTQKKKLLSFNLKHDRLNTPIEHKRLIWDALRKKDGRHRQVFKKS